MSVLMGCSTYSDKVRETQQSMAFGQLDRALEELNERLGVDSAEQVPETVDDEHVLFLLERGTVLQGLNQHELAARDMMIADEKLDVLDLSSGTADDVAKWLYSESSANYRAPAYERLLLNTLNMVNFLALRDFQSAKVEARRFQIMEDFYLEHSESIDVPAILALGNYVSAIAFEGARDYDLAARHYSRAWHFGIRNQDFRKRLEALYRVTGWTSAELDWRESGLDAVKTVARAKGGLSPSDYRKEFVEGDVVIFVQAGMVPWKRAERLPIGLAITYAASHPRYFSPEQQRQANELAVSGALKWLNFPQLTYESVPRWRTPQIAVNDSPKSVQFSTDVARAVESGWRQIEGPLIAAALTRMVTRAIAGAATREVTRSATSGEGAGAASFFGVLAQLFVEGTMTAMDKPDTRSWTTLPSGILIVREKPETQRTTVKVTVGGITDQKTIEVNQSNLSIVNFSKFR